MSPNKRFLIKHRILPSQAHQDVIGNRGEAADTYDHPLRYNSGDILNSILDDSESPNSGLRSKKSSNQVNVDIGLELLDRSSKTNQDTTPRLA